MAVSTHIRIPVQMIEEYESLKFPKEFKEAKASFTDFARNAIAEKIEKLKEAAAKKER